MADENDQTCTCESMGGRFGAHRDECPARIAFLEQVRAEEKAALLAALDRTPLTATENAIVAGYWNGERPESDLTQVMLDRLSRALASVDIPPGKQGGPDA